MVGWPKILGDVLVLAAITWVIVEIREDGARSAKTAIERQNNDRPAALIRSAMIATLALLLAGCGTSGPGSATALRSIVGTDLIGARGATPADQRKIDRTVVGICAAAVWTKRGLRETRGRALNVAEIFVSDRTAQCLVWRRGNDHDRRAGRPADVAHE